MVDRSVELKEIKRGLLREHNMKFKAVLGGRGCADNPVQVSSDENKSCGEVDHGRARRSKPPRPQPPPVKRNRAPSSGSEELDVLLKQVASGRRPVLPNYSASSRDSGKEDDRPNRSKRQPLTRRNRLESSVVSGEEDSQPNPSKKRQDARRIRMDSSADSSDAHVNRSKKRSVARNRVDSSEGDDSGEKSGNGRYPRRSMTAELSNAPEPRRSGTRNRSEVLNYSDVVNRSDTSKNDQKKKAAVVDAIIEAMENCSFEQVEWKKIREQREVKDSEDEEIDVHVSKYTGEPEEYWHQLADTMEKRGRAWELDYIVAPEPNAKPGDLNKQRSWVLIKWTNFAIPTWTLLSDVNPRGKGSSKNQDQVRMMMERMKRLNQLEAKLRAQKGDDAFDELYPHRWIDAEPLGAYVQNERALYENKAMAFEWRVNYEYAKEHKHKQRAGCRDLAAPPLHVVNWVDDAPVPGIDFQLKFTTKMIHSHRVATVLANTQEMAWVRCKHCKPSCPAPREHFHSMSHCCGLYYPTTHHYYSRLYTSRLEEPEGIEVDGKIQLGRLTSQEIESSVIVECTERCECNGLAKTTIENAPRNCQQMVLQRGRQISLFLFREDAARGWGLRAGEDVPRGAFVTEYVGEVLTAKEAEDAKGHYMFQMRYGWAENLVKTDRVRNLNGGADIIRRHRRFTVDASMMGNEARFINHSCEPNLVAVVVYVERHGEFYHRIGLFARREIEFGEELTFDYFPSADDIQAWRAMFPECRCGSKLCKFKAAKAEEEEEEEQSDEISDEEEGDEDDCASVDSFISDDEEYRRQCEESKRRKREERRRERAERMRERMEVDGEGERRKKERRERERDPRASDLRRDPFEIMKDRCGGDEERARQIMDERNQNGILHLINKEPWSVEKYDEMIRQGREMHAAREKERAARTEIKKEIKDEVESEGEQRMEKGKRGRRKKNI